MGLIALATRLKRISDKMAFSTRAMYKQLKIDIEPNWYLVLSLVREKPGIAVMDIAQQLGFMHQSVITMTDKMVKRDYLESWKDPDDRRRTVFQLTSKAERILPQIEHIWAIGEQVLWELVNEDPSMLHHLDVLEENLQAASFGDRILHKLG